MLFYNQFLLLALID